jgi:hypothetical protein
VNLAHYLGLLHRAQVELADAYLEVGEAHKDEPDVFYDCMRLAEQCVGHAEQLHPFAERYGEEADAEPDRLHSDLFQGSRAGGLGLLRDLHDLYLMAAQCDISWTLIGQAAQGARDSELLSLVQESEQDTAMQMKWLRTRMKQAAPQALVVT